MKLQTSRKIYIQLLYAHVFTVPKFLLLQIFGIVVNVLHQHAFKFPVVDGYWYTQKILFHYSIFINPYHFGCSDSQGCIRFNTNTSSLGNCHAQRTFPDVESFSADHLLLEHDRPKIRKYKP